MKHTTIAIAFLCMSPASLASGTVGGTVTGTDNRTNPYPQADCNAAPLGARQTFTQGPFQPREMLVRLRVIRESDQAVLEERWSRTNDTNGGYSIAYTRSGALGQSFRVAVYAERPLIAQGVVTVNRPDYEFRISGGSPILREEAAGAPQFNGIASVVNVTVPASEHLNAYRAMHEVYSLYTNQGGIRAPATNWPGMGFVTVNVNQAAGIRVTPLHDNVYVESGVATTDVFTIPHEMGHIVNWRGWGLVNATINPAVDYQMNDANNCSLGGVSWSRFSCEFEKVAFIEGFADMHGAMYLWNRAADPGGTCSGGLPRIPREIGTGVSVEPAGSCAPPNTTPDKNHPICNARALWDIVDNPPQDDDPFLSFDLTTPVDVLRVYPRFCVPIIGDNRCAREGDAYVAPPWNDVNGSNWKDFRANWAANSGNDTNLNTIEDQNGLDGQDNN